MARRELHGNHLCGVHARCIDVAGNGTKDRCRASNSRYPDQRCSLPSTTDGLCWIHTRHRDKNTYLPYTMENIAPKLKPRMGTIFSSDIDVISI